MSDVLYIKINQYQKHLLQDLLEENDIDVIVDDNINQNLVNVFTDLRRDHNGEAFIPHEQFFRVYVKDFGDMVLNATREFIWKLQSSLNGDSQEYIPDKIYFVVTEWNILVHKNNELLVKLPYSYSNEDDISRVKPIRESPITLDDLVKVEPLLPNTGEIFKWKKQ